MNIVSAVMAGNIVFLEGEMTIRFKEKFKLRSIRFKPTDFESGRKKAAEQRDDDD